MSKTQKVMALVAALLFLVSALVTGCSNGGEESGADEQDYRIKIFSGGNLTTSLNLTQLQSLPNVSLSAFGKSEEGPTLLLVLELAGVKEFTKVTVVGMVRGRLASGELTLNRDEITGDVILDFTNRGTTKLAGAQIPEDDWIIDVTEIRTE